MSEAPIKPVPYDPEVWASLEAVLPYMPTFASLDDIPQARVGVPGMEQVTNAQLERDGRFRVEERLVPGPDGAPDVALIICTPVSAATPPPVLYNIHGGGMVVGNFRDGVEMALDWADEFGAAVVSVEYRLAPEAQGLALVEDCYAGLVWTVRNAADLGLDPTRVVVVGMSAGGGLAAGTTLLARDRGEVAVAAQLLMCPMLDDRNDTFSAIQMAGLGIWPREFNYTGWEAVLGDQRGGEDVSPYIAPARATDLSGLPPTLVDVSSAETFRDEAITFVNRIWQAGGTAELHVWSGGNHGFDVVAPQALVSQQTRVTRVNWLRRQLGY
ncbi:alpha/beta hydrolase [Arthrobacter sp. Z4-13]